MYLYKAIDKKNMWSYHIVWRLTINILKNIHRIGNYKKINYYDKS